MPRNWETREAKLEKRRSGMKVSGRSVFLIQDIIGRKSKPKPIDAREIERIRKRHTVTADGTVGMERDDAVRPRRGVW